MKKLIILFSLLFTSSLFARTGTGWGGGGGASMVTESFGGLNDFSGLSGNDSGPSNGLFLLNEDRNFIDEAKYARSIEELIGLSRNLDTGERVRLSNFREYLDSPVGL